ncbi:MAG: hypothetical protein QM736_03485 [Vicinamibacterales bacterium]
MTTRWWTAIVLIASISLWSAPARAQQPQRDASTTAAVDTARWRELVEQLEPAAFVNLRTRDRARQKGTIVAHDADGFSFQPRTRIPVDPVFVRYDDVRAIERTHAGLSPGTKVLIGAGSIVGGTVIVMAILFASLGD